MKTFFKLTALLIISNGIFFYQPRVFAEKKKCPSGDIQLKDLRTDPSVLNSKAKVDIRLNIFKNSSPSCANKQTGKTIFAVHGLAHSGKTWNPLAEKIFAEDKKCEVGRVIAINLPGRGGSSENVKGLTSDNFSDLDLENYRYILRESLNELQKYDCAPDTIMGHSMGGLLVTMLQEDLLKQNTNLAQKYGIKHAILLAPAIPQPCEWHEAGKESALKAIKYIGFYGARKGAHLKIKSEDAKKLFFSNRQGIVPEDQCGKISITPEDIKREALDAANQMIRVTARSQLYPAQHTPTYVRVGAFENKNGTRLTSIAHREDIFMKSAEIKSLHQHLTTNQSCLQNLDLKAQESLRQDLQGYVYLDNECAVHNMYISAPELLAPEVFRATIAEDVNSSQQKSSADKKTKQNSNR